MIIVSAIRTGVFNEQDEFSEGYTITATLTESEVQELLANYDSNSGTSPSVSFCRPLARAILDSLAAKE